MEQNINLQYLLKKSMYKLTSTVQTGVVKEPTVVLLAIHSNKYAISLSSCMSFDNFKHMIC